jgi:glutamine cyclotransferase
LDPETFEEVNQIEVSANKIPITRINELEYIQGEIYANIWLTERIVRINPLTGQVIGWIDLKGILSPEDHSETVDVLNGIAYDAKNNRLFVTGKFWPKIFEIELTGQGTVESKRETKP